MAKDPKMGKPCGFFVQITAYDVSYGEFLSNYESLFNYFNHWSIQLTIILTSFCLQNKQ